MKAKLLSLLAGMLVTTAGYAEDIYYCRGGLVGVGDWALTENYPLTKGEDGIYSGEVDMLRRTEMTNAPTMGWGNRVDLFFNVNKANWVLFSATAEGRFITPGKTDWYSMTGGGGATNPFQCVGGKYMVYLDPDNMRVRFEAIDPAYLDEVIVYGQLKDCRWQRLGTNEETGVSYKLKHQGNGVYTGRIELEESNDGYGDFCICASWAGGNEGRYASSAPNMNLLPGVEYACDRYYGDRNWRIPVGTYDVTFDMSHQTIRVNTVDEPDVVVSLAYAELKAAIEEAEERFPGIDLTSAKNVLDDPESTDEQLAAAKSELSATQLAYLLGKMNQAGETNPVDATYLVKDPTCHDGNGWGGTTMNYNNGVLNVSGKDFNTHQEIGSLPNGVYRVSLKGVSRYGAGNVFYTQPTQLTAAQRNIMLYATSAKVRMNKPFGDIHDKQYSSLANEGANSEADYSGQGWYSPTNVNSARVWMRQGRYDDNHVMAYVNDGTLTIGLSREKHQDDDALFADDWNLTYYGDNTEALALIANDVEETNEGYQDIMAQQTVKEALETAIAQAKEATDLAAAYKTLAEAETALRQSVVAYLSYKNKIEAIRAQVAEQPDLKGPAAELLNTYLQENKEPSDALANGTAAYIMANGTLDVAQLAAEEAHAELLLGNALKANVAPGTDITSLFINTDWTQKDWAGWTVEKKEDANATSSSNGGLEGNKVATWYNWVSGSITQTLEGLPEGIYALTYNGLMRTGQPHRVIADDDMNAYAVVGNMCTPMLNAYDGALPLGEAVEGENCSSDDYKNDDVRFPGTANGASIAFKAGRYQQTAYGMTVDGKLTIGWTCPGYPNYWEDWMAVSAVKVVYLGQDAKAAKAMADAAKTRGETVMASFLGFREDTREHLGDALSAEPTDYEALCKQASDINLYCNEAWASAPHYNSLETAVNDYETRAEYAVSHNGISMEKRQAIQAEVGTVQGNLMAGTYADDEAEQLAKVYQQKAKDLIPMQVRGGLEGVGNWDKNETYLLFKNDEGIYEGNFTMVNASNLSMENTWWGNRGDLFFVDQSDNFYGAINSPENYIVPSDTTWHKLQKRYNGIQTPFQLQGGKYHVLLDMDRQYVSFSNIEEFWMDSVYCVGTLQDFHYSEAFENFTYALRHTEHGVYKGKVTVVPENDGDENGLLAIMTSYKSGKSEGRYASAIRTTMEPGVVYQAPRSATTTNAEANFFTVPAGEWLVTFDMNHSTLRINSLDDPDLVKDGLVEEHAVWYAVGGLEGVGNWAETTAYPLVMNKDGLHEGLVTFSDENLLLVGGRWGNRADLFFKSSLGLYMEPEASLDNDQKFITPAKNKPMATSTKRERNGIRVFQALGGTYRVLLDERNLTVQYECVDEKWLDAVYVRGTLKGFRWQHAVQEDSLNVLRHVGHGVYQGVIDLEEDNSVTSGKFAIKADFNDTSSEAIYSPKVDGTPIDIDGEAVPVYRWNDSSKCLLAPIGKLFVTFDMNNGWVKISDPDNPDSIEKIGLTTVPTNTAVGIYTLDGRKVYSGNSQWNTATPGIYIMVKDGQARKVLVK